MTILLTDLKEGDYAQVTNLSKADEHLLTSFHDLGICVGAELELTHKTSLLEKSPRIIKVLNALIALRYEEAQCIEVQKRS